MLNLLSPASVIESVHAAIQDGISFYENIAQYTTVKNYLGVTVPGPLEIYL